MISLYTDGSAKGNPGKGGYGAGLLSGKHRKELKTNFYFWLIKNKFPDPDEFQVLCHNCNMATKDGGICPHQRRNK